MTHRIELAEAYILHTRPFRNTSLFVELFAKEFGRLNAVARSARGIKSRYRGQLQLFTPIFASWSGLHELKTLGNIELNGMPIPLNHTPLFCGFYLNELLMRLLHKDDPYPVLFDLYHHSLNRLANNDSIPMVLRLFEKKLLDALGYGLPLKFEATKHEKIQPDCSYRYEHQYGFILTEANNASDTFSGKDLIALDQEKLETESVLKTAKRLTRFTIENLLGNKPLNSRFLF